MDVTSSFPPPTSSATGPAFPLREIHSAEFRTRVLREYSASTFNADGSFALFRWVQGLIGACDPSHRTLVWKRVLDVIKEDDKSKYQRLHKGEPFYWMALASYAMRDFEAALFYMDCALAEDIRNYEARWQTLPAALFVRLDDSRIEQAGLYDVKAIRSVFDQACRGANARFSLAFSVEEYRRRLVARAIARQGTLRSAVTAFITFVLEFSDRRWQLSVAPEHASTNGTGEPFLLHLFKGCALFETLLKAADCAPQRPGVMLGDLMQHEPLYRMLGSSRAIEGLGSLVSLDELFAALSRRRADGSMDALEDVRTSWGLRNLIGHNLALPRRPTLAEYDELFSLVFAALARAICKLYDSQN